MLNILFEDNHLLAVEKPKGLLTQETAEEHDSLENRAKAWLKETYKKPGNVFIGVIHRLDRPASGIVLFAKTSKALSRLNAQMRARKMQKTYEASIKGRLPMGEGTLKHFMQHDEFKATICPQSAPEAKLAILHYKTLENVEGQSLLEIILETGRYHQIRAQLSAIGHPICGDAKYGSTHPMPRNTIALHHTKLVFEHPITKQRMEIISPNKSLTKNS